MKKFVQAIWKRENLFFPYLFIMAGFPWYEIGFQRTIEFSGMIIMPISLFFLLAMILLYRPGTTEKFTLVQKVAFRVEAVLMVFLVAMFGWIGSWVMAATWLCNLVFLSGIMYLANNWVLDESILGRGCEVEK